MGKCERCGTEFEGRADKKFCSKSCKHQAAKKRARKNLKHKAVIYLGGKCIRCGYEKCIDALEFHHRDENEKDFTISNEGQGKSWVSIQRELEKCVLLCANCHREKHANERVTNNED